MNFTIHASVLGLLLATTAVGCCHRSRTIEVRAAMAQDGVRVSGEGEARGRPDVARVTLGVEVRAATAAEATDRVSRAMQQVLQAVQAQGVPEADIQTEQVTVHFEQEHIPPPPPPRPLPQGEESTGPESPSEPTPETALPRGYYRAFNTVRVTLRDLNRVSAVLTAASAAGANVVHGIAFEIDDPTPLREQAREKAVQDAQRQAQQLAALAGARLGRVLSINTQAFGYADTRALPATAMVRQHADVPVEPGELVVRQRVEIVYALERPEE